MAERVKPVPTPAPVAQLVDAWNDRVADRFAAVFAPDARLTVPPLHLEFTGQDDIWRAAAGIFGAFGALRYTLRHRYLAPEGVTDEALLEGLQTREFLGAPPSGKPGAVAVRVMLTHDGQRITSLTLWPDVAALRELSDGVARRIDLRSAGPAAPVVAALRATIPAPEGKFSIGQGRQLTAVDEVSTLLPGGPAVAPRAAGGDGAGGNGGEEAKARGKKDGPKAPLPRKVRRRRAVLGGLVMLALAGVLVAYVVQGVRGKQIETAEPKPAPQATAAVAATSAPPSPRPSPSPSSTAQRLRFDPLKNTFTVGTPLLFELNSATLRPDAVSTLEQIVRQVIREHRYGTIVVTGYTDNSGTAQFNQALSKQRAQAVADYLDQHLGSRYRLKAIGKGELDNARPNTTEANRAANRRVVVLVPPARTAAAPTETPSVENLPAPSAT